MKTAPIRISLVFAVAAAAALSLTPAKPHAAPQILAALPLEAGIELNCGNGLCAVELSTYCLQRERAAPSMGTAYVPAKPEHFTLVLNDDKGAEVRLPAGEHMTFVENRGFMSVAAAIEQGRLKALGASRAKLVIWEGASLIPVPEPNDPDPLTPDEIAFVTDSLRTHGQQFVDSRPQAETAQILARLNSKLPSTGPISAKTFDGMWQQAIGDDVPLPTGPGLTGAREAYEDCANSKSTYFIDGLRRCIEFKHDDLMRHLNIDYWEHQPGS